MSHHAQVGREEGGAHRMAEGEVVCTSLKADGGKGRGRLALLLLPLDSPLPAVAYSRA